MSWPAPDPAAGVQDTSNVVEADVPLRLTEGDPWRLPLRWETEAGAAIDMSGPGWTVWASLSLATGRRAIACALTEPADGWFQVSLGVEDVAALATARPDRLIVSIEDPAGQRFHFVFPVIRRVL